MNAKSFFFPIIFMHIVHKHGAPPWNPVTALVTTEVFHIWEQKSTDLTDDGRVENWWAAPLVRRVITAHR